jgi:hypothetical protein
MANGKQEVCANRKSKSGQKKNTGKDVLRTALVIWGPFTIL